MRKMSLKLAQKILLLTSIPLAFVLVTLAMVAAVQRSTATAAGWAEHSQLVLAQAGTLLQTMIDAEDDQRGYLLTSDPAYLARSRRATTTVSIEVADLERLVSDNAVQENNARKLAATSTARLRALENTVAAFGSSSTSHPAMVAQLRAGTSAMGRFRRQMQAFTNEEVRLQKERDAALARSFDLLNRVLATGAILVIALTLFIISVFSRGAARRISELGEKAQRIADGQPIGLPAAYKSNDEIAQADRAFHSMAAIVAERQEVLARYRLLAEHTRDIILFVRRNDMQIIEANEAAVATYGYSRAELLSITYRDLRVQEDRETLEAHLERSDRGPVFYEARHQRKDGTTFPVEVTGQGAFVAGERVLLSIIRDVTDRKRAEDERDRFFEASIDMMAVANFAGYFVRLNPAWERTLGYSRHELMAIPFVQHVHPDDVDATNAAMRVLGEDKTVSGFENRYRHKDGGYLWFSWSAIPSLDEGLIYAVARDVTERMSNDEALARSRDQANEASRIKSEFLANMSHEIRTPMNGIIGTTGLLQSMALTSEQRVFVDIIKESGDALLTIINQILDISKLEAGKMALDVVDFSPVSVVENISMLFASAARQKNLSIQSYVAPDVPSSLRGDAGQIRQILINLTGNAVKFTESGGIAIRVVTAAAANDSIVLKFFVSDTGIGLPPAALERLFEPFSQADSSTTRRFGGTGLGLSISKRLVELMGGEIGVEANEGLGTTFWFTARFERSPSELPRPGRELFGGVRVLVADPDEVARDVLHQYLYNWGMRNGVTASTARQALDMLLNAADESDPYDIAFIDAGIAQEKDSEFVRGVASDRRLTRTSMILLKPIAAIASGAGATPSGFAYFLSKPIRQSYLFDCIAAALHRTKTALGESHQTPPERAQGNGHGSVLRGRRVLVAEDNEINRKLAAAQFKRLGIEADFVTDGRQAVDAVESGDYALVYMDCQMPEMDGFEATHAIRKAEQLTGAHIPIVAMTANAMEGDREACVARGMDDYVSKPVNLERLRATVEHWLPRGAAAAAGATVPEKANGATPLDLGRLREFFGDDADSLRGLLVATIEESQSVYGRLVKALDARDMQTAMRAAHELKGFAANVGAVKVSALAAHIEGSVAADDWRAAKTEAPDLVAAIDSMVAFASSAIEELAGSRRA
jgi:PAS domain S-box-containing protein